MSSCFIGLPVTVSVSEQSLKSILVTSLPFTADGHFSVPGPPEWYQSKPGSQKSSLLVNSAESKSVKDPVS